MAFLTQRIAQSIFRRGATIRAAQVRAEPDVVVLPVRAGHSPCNKPPVRIYLGTETAQYKAERVFIWSIEEVRDPTRVYEIYLMKHLRGFRSRFWLTGFTNYRFAIPHFAGKSGRAIYNDVDQIYLKDPAELFDLEMDEHAYLAIDAGDTSVALFDCERMSKIWTLEDAQSGRKNPLLARASGVAGQWGKLDGGWNARDREYVAGASGVLHYTSLHRQPWHPFPQLFVYQSNPLASVWFDLESSANEADFRVFSANSPSRDFTDLCRAVAGEPGIERITALDPGKALDTTPARAGDAIVCQDLLEFMPDDDVPWILKQLFERADRELYCDVVESAINSSPGPLVRHKRSADWWQYQFEIVARHHPRVHWRLSLYDMKMGTRRKPRVIEGNECNDNKAIVWVLANQKPGHTSQATALAEMIGWSFLTLRIPQSLSAMLRVLLHLPGGSVTPLKPPWPNVIVACGWWPTRVARWVQRRSGGRVRLLLAGRKCGPVRSPTDVLVSCRHFHLPIHERRIETMLPIQPLSEAAFVAARQRGEDLFGDAARPRVALLVGGSSKQHSLSAEDAGLLGSKVLEQTNAASGSLFAVTSRRTGEAAIAALETSLQEGAHLHVWSAHEKENPYWAYLAAADILVVTGESESMLADAVSTGKPVYIFPLQQKRYGPWLGLGAKLAKWSQRRPKNRRGTERPQQGFEYFCSRILKHEWILPPRDLETLHRELTEQGLARMFDESLSRESPTQVLDTSDLTRRLRIMLAQPKIESESQVSHFSHDAAIEA